MKIDDVIARVRAETDNGLLIADARTGDIVRRTVAALGLEIAANGEIYSPEPAPAPRPTWQPPAQQNVRYRGQRRRR